MTLGLLGACVGPQTPAHDSERAHVDSGATRGFDVVGRVLALDGSPVTELFVTVSTEYCIPDRTDEDGGFRVGDVTDGDKRLITYGETASNGLFASVVIPFSAFETIEFAAPIWTPELERIALDPASGDAQELTSADGISVTIPAGSLSLAPFMPDELQVARVPIEQAPPFGDDLVLIDMAALHPIQSTFSTPAPVQFPAHDGLATGTGVLFHSLNYDTGRLEAVATGHISAEGRPTTDPGQGITELTWVGITLDDQ